jgi:hypothetical protein
MHGRHLTFAAIVLAAIAAPSSKAHAATPKHLAVAERLVNHLDLENTNYQHGEPQVSFQQPFESHTDCSGFLDSLLSFSYGLDKDDFKNWFDSSRPSARRYHDAIAEEKGFQLIDRVQNVLPGDILAVKYLKRTDNTGHVMLVAGRPKQMQAKEPLVPGTLQWEAPIIDSSETGHGPADTRHKQGVDGKDHDGLGKGILRIYSDPAGHTIGFAWSTLKASKFKSPDDEHLLIGRLK